MGMFADVRVDTSIDLPNYPEGMVVRNGDIQMVSGIGPATAEEILKSIESIRTN